MSKILKLKQWLNLEDSAALLGSLLEEKNLTVKSLCQLALENEVGLSFFFDSEHFPLCQAPGLIPKSTSDMGHYQALHLSRNDSKMLLCCLSLNKPIECIAPIEVTHQEDRFNIFSFTEDDNGFPSLQETSTLPLENLGFYSEDLKGLHDKVNPNKDIPHPKTRNAYLRTISALVETITNKRTGQPYKDAGIAMKAMAAASVEAPISEEKLGDYLQEADKLI
jgi:hypothetical protein